MVGIDLFGLILRPALLTLRGLLIGI